MQSIYHESPEQVTATKKNRLSNIMNTVFASQSMFQRRHEETDGKRRKCPSWKETEIAETVKRKKKSV